MATDEAPPIVSDAEIEAALAEAEAQTHGIPSLDDGAGQSVVHVPVEPAPRPPSRLQPEPERAKRDPLLQAPSEPVTEAGRDAKETEAEADRRSWRGALRIVYQAVDTALWAINRPFEWMSPEARRLTGALAIVTIVTSLLASYVLPMLCPPRDVISQLSRQSLEARAALPGRRASTSEQP